MNNNKTINIKIVKYSILSALPLLLLFILTLTATFIFGVEFLKEWWHLYLLFFLITSGIHIHFSFETESLIAQPLSIGFVLLMVFVNYWAFFY